MQEPTDISQLLSQIYERGIKEQVPNISSQNACFIGSMITKHQPKRMLEIGTAHGYSAIYFANILKEYGGVIDTIEFSDISYYIAEENISRSSLDNIYQYFGDARDIIPYLDYEYDFVFIDGLKKASLEFYLLSIQKLSKNAIIVVDDVIKFKHKMQNFYEYLDSHNIEYSIQKVDSDDGIMIIKL